MCSLDCSTSVLEIETVSKIFYTKSGQAITAVDSVSFSVPENSFVCIVGPSGCGKSTLLRMIAGLDQGTMGSIVYRGQKQDRPRREIGMIFQEYSLFPWLSVVDNIAFGPRLRGCSQSESTEIGRNYLELVGLSAYARAMPYELSGGMRQRVAIARALANDPDILLMDEPFGALDAFTRIQLQKHLLNLWQHHKKTILFVTHSVDEAIFLADTIYVMGARPGRLVSTLNVDFERPRQRDNPDFSKMLIHVLGLLEQGSAEG